MTAHWTGIMIKNSRLAWCYGDFGVAKSFLEIGDFYSKSSLVSIAEQIFLKMSHRDISNSFVTDPFFCHGSSGLVYIFKKLYRRFGLIEYSDSYTYWLNQLETNKNRVYSDHKKRYENDFGVGMFDYDLLNGVLGIQLVLREEEFNDEIFIIDSI